jgi:RsiW-degrading membrane proteinase PrsW (M82 family)
MSAVIILVVAVSSAFGAHFLASRKGRSPKWWVIATLLLGPLPLIPLALLPSRSAVAA